MATKVLANHKVLVMVFIIEEFTIEEDDNDLLARPSSQDRQQPPAPNFTKSEKNCIYSNN